jgi:hypothetical protein
MGYFVAGSLWIKAGKTVLGLQCGIIFLRIVINDEK